VGWAIVAALGVVLVVQGWMLRLALVRLMAQLAVLTVVVHEVQDKIVDLVEELHAIDET
jgi:hypothetical protein